MIIELIGWIGAICLTLCGLPQAYKTYKTQNLDGMSIGMLLAWNVGCIATFVYIAFTTFQIPLLANYFINILITGYLSYMYFKCKKN